MVIWVATSSFMLICGCCFIVHISNNSEAVGCKKSDWATTSRLFISSLSSIPEKSKGWGAMAPRPPLPLHCFRCRLKDKVGQGNKRRNIVIWGAEQLSKNENPQRTHCTMGWNLLWRRNSVTFVYLKFSNSLYLISTIINCC